MSLISAPKLFRYARLLVEPLKQSTTLRHSPQLSANNGLTQLMGRTFITSNANVKNQEMKPESQQSPAAGSPPPSADPATDNLTENERNLKNEIQKLNESITTLTEEKATLQDKYKRALADSENLRTRLTKQIEDAKIFGIQSFCKDILEVADVLNKATESVPKEELNDNNPHLKSLYEGLIMTESQLQKVFKRHGLEAVNPIDEKFDPNFHEALFQQDVPGKSPGLVINVSKIGYKLHDRCLRPALVGVSKS